MRLRLSKDHVASLLLALGAPAGVTLFRFGPHLQWRFSGGWYLTRDVQAIPVRPLPDEPAPDRFARCRLGSVAFRQKSDIH